MSKDPPPPYEQKHLLHNEQQTPPPGPSQQTIYVTQTTTIPLAFGPTPMKLTCPSCKKFMTTSIKIEANTKTHLFALLLCAIGCWLCCCLPYLCDGCQSKKHYCGNCQTYLGVYSD